MYQLSRAKALLQEEKKRRLMKETVHLNYLEDGGIKFLTKKDLLYLPSKSGTRFHTTHKPFKNIMGPFGSGKTTICCMELLHQAANMPYCKDGIRRAKYVCMRNTTPQLYTSVFKSWIAWMEDLGEVHISKKPVLEVTHKYNDGKGLIELILVFLACDRDEDLYKLKSTEFTGVYLNELSEFGPAILGYLAGRKGRYPQASLLPSLPDGTVPDRHGCIITDTNPPDTDHWLYKVFEENHNPDEFLLVKQPPGLIEKDGKWERNLEADNIKYLDVNYYTNIASLSTKEFTRVFCLGQYGFVQTGKFVYESFNDDVHSVDEIKVDRNHPMYFGWDLSLHPSFVACQYIGGQLRVIKECYLEYGSISDLLESLVMPWINTYCKDLEYTSICDPSDQKSASDGISCIMRMKEFGIVTQKSIGNGIIDRIDAVKKPLNSMVQGKPAFQVSKKGCPMLRKGFLGEYQFKRVNILSREVYKEVPDKKHPVSDVHDALQYVALHLFSPFKKKEKIDVSKFRQVDSWT